MSVSSAAFNWNGTKKKIEVVQQTDFNPFSVSQFRHSFLFPLIGRGNDLSQRDSDSLAKTAFGLHLESLARFVSLGPLTWRQKQKKVHFENTLEKNVFTRSRL